MAAGGGARCLTYLNGAANKSSGEIVGMFIGVIPLVLPVLLTMPIIYYTCKNLLSPESIDSRISLVSFTIMARSKAVILC